LLKKLITSQAELYLKQGEVALCLGMLVTTGTGKFIETEGKIDGCRKNLQEIVLQSQEHKTHETIHLPADRPHRAEVTIEWLKIKKVNIL